jgi:hypothetical protein
MPSTKVNFAMDIKELLKEWSKYSGVKMAAREYQVRLPVHDAARVAALVEMYPLKGEADIITSLLSVALDAVEVAFPYVQGAKVIAEDELGDPIYEDIGPTPRFLSLSNKHADRLMAEGSE